MRAVRRAFPSARVMAAPSNLTSTSGPARGTITAMELRHLRTIVAVARHRSLTKAAEQLYLTQSAISQQIRRLEQELGVEVFRRTSRSVELTAGGPGDPQLRRARALGGRRPAHRARGDHRPACAGSCGSAACTRRALRPVRDARGLPRARTPAWRSTWSRTRRTTCSPRCAATSSTARSPPWTPTRSARSSPPRCCGRRRSSSRCRRAIPLCDAARVTFEELGGGGPHRLSRELGPSHVAWSARWPSATSSRATRSSAPRWRRCASLASKGLGVAVIPRSVAEEPGPPIELRPIGAARLTWPVALVWRAARRQTPAGGRSSTSRSTTPAAPSVPGLRRVA